MGVKPFEVRVTQQTLDDLRDRLGTRIRSCAS